MSGITLGSIVSLMNQAASDSERGANVAMSRADSALNAAIAEDRREKATIAAAADEAEKEKEEFNRKMQGFNNKVSSSVAPVSPQEQASLISMLPADQQNYATTMYNLLS